MVMTVRDTLARDPGYRIEPVVKVYDKANLLEDLRQFVITDSLARELRKFFDAFTGSLRARIRRGSAGDGMAVWISGFFGCGKSHVAKVLGYVLENDIVDPESGWTAIDQFRVHLDDPTLPAANDLKAGLQEIRTHAWCMNIPFEIKSKADPTSPESVTEICLRTFYERLGLAPTIWVARLERRLQTQGCYEAFLAAYREQTGKEWSEDREAHGFYMTEFANALAAARGHSYEQARETLAIYQRDHARVTPENAVAEWLDYLDGMRDQVSPREPHLIFVIDEMGQYIADSSDRIQELQAIIEQAGNRGNGRIWFLCTSQEALDQVVDRTGLRLSALGKLDARFSVKIPLTGEDVRHVVQQRLLRKKETVRYDLEEFYSRHAGPISDLCDLRLERRLAALDAKSFIGAYPFMPHMIPLVQELFNAMRGFKLSGTERSMIGLAQGALQRVAHQPLGTVVSLDIVFDQVTDELSASDYLGSTGIKLIREADQQVPDTPLPASAVLKVLWLVSRVEWVPRTPEVLARLLAGRIGTDIGLKRAEVETTLQRLLGAGYVGRDEATGQYRYLSEIERTIEGDIVARIQDLGTGIGTARRLADEIIKERILTPSRLGNYRIPLGRSGSVPMALKLDGEAITSTGEIAVEVYSPLASPDMEAIELQNLGWGRKGQTVWWIAGADDTLLPKLMRIAALDYVLQQPRWRKDQSDETERLVGEKAKEQSTLQSHVAGLLQTCLERGRVLYSGEETDLDGAKGLREIIAEFGGAVAGNLYLRYRDVDKPYDESALSAYLKPTATALHQLNTAHAIYDPQDNLNRSAPLVAAIYEEQRRREDEHEDLSGSAIVDHFGRIPFGWPEALVRLALAAMLRGGALNIEPPDSDRPIYDVTEPGIEELFKSRLRFAKTRFHPTVGELTPDERSTARQALIAMGETQVPDAPHALADRLRAVGRSMQEKSQIVQQRVADLSLPLPDTYGRVEPVTTPATSLRDPVACVRRFIEDRAEWSAIAAYLAAYDDFVGNRRDEAYRTYAALTDLARDWLASAHGEDAESARAALAEFDAIVSAREIMTRWKTLQEATLVVTDAYGRAYRQAYEACRTEIHALETEMKDSSAYLRLSEDQQSTLQARYFGAHGSLGLSAPGEAARPRELLSASKRHRISELASLRMGVPGYRTSLYAECDRLYQEQAQAHQPVDGGQGGDGPALPPRVHYVDVRQKLGGKRFVTREAFDALWQEIAQEITDKLDDGYEVMIQA